MFEVFFDELIDLVIDRFQLLSEHIILYSKSVYPFVLFDDLLSAGLAAIIIAGILSLIELKDFGFVIDGPEQLLILFKLLQFAFFIGNNVLQIIEGLLVTKGFLMGRISYRVDLVFFLFFSIVFFFLLICSWLIWLIKGIMFGTHSL